MAIALAGNDPTMVFESQRLHDRVEIEPAMSADYAISFGKAAVRRAG